MNSPGNRIRDLPNELMMGWLANSKELDNAHMFLETLPYPDIAGTIVLFDWFETLLLYYFPPSS